MSYLFDGVDDALTVASAPATAVPLTISVWFKSDSATVTQVAACLGIDASTSHQFRVVAAGATGGDPVQAATTQVSGSLATSTSGYSPGTWHHGCGVFAAANSRAAYIDGGSKGTETTSRTPVGINATFVGRRSDSVQFFDGRIAEVAVWNVALSDAEVALLAGGDLPTTIQAGNLVAYWPLLDDANDDVGARHLSVIGATLDADHPPVDSGAAEHERSAAISGTAAVAAAGQFFSVFERSASVSATGGIATAPQRALQRSSALSATAAVTTAATFFSILERAAAVAATAAVVAAGQRDLQRSASATAAGSIAASGQIEGGEVTHERSAAITATAGVATVGQFWSTFERTVALGASGAVSTTGRRDLLRQAALAGSGAISATGQADLRRSASLAVVAAINASGGQAAFRWNVDPEGRWPDDTDGRWLVTAGSRWN
jgi:hypothetical protein